MRMPESTRDELSDLAEKLYDELRLVEVYIENHEGIKDSTWKDIDQLLTSAFNRLTDLKNTVENS